MKQNSYYNKKHRPLARDLRKNGTLGEQILWIEVLQGRKFYGYHFNRQYPFKNYIVDFICRKLKLITEIDGYSHRFKFKEDKRRDVALNKLGYTVIRFEESEIRNDLENVISVLESYLPDNQSP